MTETYLQNFLYLKHLSDIKKPPIKFNPGYVHQNNVCVTQNIDKKYDIFSHFVFLTCPCDIFVTLFANVNMEGLFCPESPLGALGDIVAYAHTHYSDGGEKAGCWRFRVKQVYQI